MPTVEEHRARLARARSKKPQETSLTICLDPSLIREREELVSRGPGIPAEEMEALDQRIKDETVKLTMRSIGRLRFDALCREHPPTEEQDTEHRAEFQSPAPYNVDTFAPALVAASMTAAVLNPLKCTDEEWDELYAETLEEVIVWADEWNALEFVPLWTSALAANTASSTGLVGKAFG